MAKIVGIRKFSFKGNDGTIVSGYNVHLVSPFYSGASNPGYGEQVERIFMTDSKLADALMIFGSAPALVGVECEPVYNRFGKVAMLNFPGEM